MLVGIGISNHNGTIMVPPRRVVKLPPNKRMQAARAKAIWYGRSMLTGVDKVPLLSRGDAREPDASR
jgi:hypothetical protein